MSTESSRIMVLECQNVFEKLINFAIYINSDHHARESISMLMFAIYKNIYKNSDHHARESRSMNVLKIADIHPINDTMDEFHLLMEKVDDLELSNIQDLSNIGGKPQLQLTPSGGGCFCKLTYLRISKCCSMKYVFSPSCAKAFQQLKALHLYNCSRMEQIIGEGDHYNGGEVVIDETIIFKRLTEISLNKLPQFRCFYPKMKRTKIEGNSSIWTTTAESIFDEKVSFSELEELKIVQLPMKDIWNQETIQSSNQESFSKLKKVHVESCDNLVNVFASNILSRLRNLEILDVSSCPSLTLLVEDLNPDIQSPTDKFKFIDVFLKLRDLKLGQLHTLMKIWPNDEDYCFYDNSDQSYLKIISIKYCGSLRYVFSAFVARHLSCIEQLFVQACPEMEVIVSKTSGEVTDDGIIKFRHLKSLELNDLPNLKSFYQCKSETSYLFNHQVSLLVLEKLKINQLPVENLFLNIQSPAVNSKFDDVFPRLRDLELDNLPKLMKIWSSDEDYYSCDDSVNSHLKSISITSCGSLRQAFSTVDARYFVHIKRLRVKACLGIEVIVSEAREGVIDDGIIEFCQLKKLHLVNLSNLKSFYQSKPEASHLFNHQVTFSNIKSLFLRDLNRSKEIQLWDLLATTQDHLNALSIIGCQVSTKVSSHHHKRSFRTIDKLSLQNCNGFKRVIDFNGTISIGKEQFGDLKILNLDDIPELVLQWNKNLHEIGGLGSLKHIRIAKCPQLRSLFTHFMATALQHLEWLKVRSCEMMEEIILIEENNINFAGDVKTNCYIELPRLTKLTLFDLPNLKNFCNDESGSFRFPSLRKVEVKDCPKMKTFASGEVCMPLGRERIHVRGHPEIIDDDERIPYWSFPDLNACFELWSKDSNQNTLSIHCGDWRRDRSFERDLESRLKINDDEDF